MRGPTTGSATGPEGQLEGREPHPPAPVVAWVRRWGGVEPGAPAPLTPGLRALRAALEEPEGAREGAHALLAADALLTWAVEDAAHATDPGAALESLLQDVAHATLASPPSA